MSRYIYLDKGLALNPETIRSLLDEINPARYDERLSADRFSLREIIAHLADLEPVFQARFEMALKTPGVQVPNFDEDKEAIEKNYASWNVEESFEKFKAERSKTLNLLLSLSEEQLKESTVTHPLLGTLSIYDLAVFLLGHDAYHIEQIAGYLNS